MSKANFSYHDIQGSDLWRQLESSYLCFCWLAPILVRFLAKGMTRVEKCTKVQLCIGGDLHFLVLEVHFLCICVILIIINYIYCPRISFICILHRLRTLCMVCGVYRVCARCEQRDGALRMRWGRGLREWG